MKREGPRAVGDLVVSAVPELRERLVADQIRRSWGALAGPDVARHAHPHKLANGCLHVAVDNSPWLQELTLRAGELTARVAARFGTVRSLRLALGRPDIAPMPQPSAPPQPRRLGPDDLREIDETVAVIGDPHVRDAARRLLGTARRFAPPRGTV